MAQVTKGNISRCVTNVTIPIMCMIAIYRLSVLKELLTYC